MKSNILFFLVFIFNVQSAVCLVASQPVSIFDRMSQEEVLEVNLEFDISTLKENKLTGEDYEAKLSFPNEGGMEVWNVKVKPRGKYRRMKCVDIPPLKLKFKKGDLALKGLGTSNDLKLVPQCIEDAATAKEILLREFLVYKLYNVITDESFRVQLLKINYVDSKTGQSSSQMAFLIEDTAQLRERINAKKFKFEGGIEDSLMNREHLKTVALFNYMVGNFDYNPSIAKNVKPVLKNGKVKLVPYDFDFAVMVKAPYATLSDDIKIKHWTERVYLGYESDVENMEATFEQFKTKKKELVRTVKNFKLLNSTNRKEILFYLNSFFEAGTDIKTKAYFQALHDKKIAER